MEGRAAVGSWTPECLWTWQKRVAKAAATTTSTGGNKDNNSSSNNNNSINNTNNDNNSNKDGSSTASLRPPVDGAPRQQRARLGRLAGAPGRSRRARRRCRRGRAGSTKLRRQPTDLRACIIYKTSTPSATLSKSHADELPYPTLLHQSHPIAPPEDAVPAVGPRLQHHGLGQRVASPRLDSSTSPKSSVCHLRRPSRLPRACSFR